MKLKFSKAVWSLGVATLCISPLPLQAEVAGSKPIITSQPANKTITGTVVDANNEPVIGAVVVVTGTSNGTVTDANGNFKYSIPSTAVSITITSIGYKDKLVKLGDKTNFQIIMEEEQENLDEVVVVGYGTLKKKEMTSAIAHVSPKDFAKISTVDASMLLQGKVAGLSVVNIGVGDPNQHASLQIRGVSSRSAGLFPLIVIDGIPGGNLSNINPADIESIDVLKDGAASAIYGTRASNGVILINLKKGTRDGQIHTSYDFAYTLNAAKREIDLLTANEFRQYIAVNNPILDKGSNTDWFKEATQLGIAQKHTLTLSGGNIKTNYRGTVDYRNARGIDLRSDRREYGARANLNHTTAGGLLTFSVNVAPRYIKRNKSDWDWFVELLSNNPTMPVKDIKGNYTDFFGQPGTNILEDMNLISNGAEIKLLAWDASAQLNLLPLLAPKRDDMSLTARLNFAEHYVDKFHYYYSPSTTSANKRSNYTGQASRAFDYAVGRNVDFVINYSWDWKNSHHIRAMLGYSYDYGMSQGMGASNKNFQSDALLYNNLDGGEWNAAEKGRTGVSSYKNDNKLIAFFGRLNYNYDDKYIASFSIRHEGSSRFGFNKKWGNFPAVSAGWRISKEKFMQDIPWLSELKLRYDFGVTGNQNFGNYQSLATYRAFGQYTYENIMYHVWGPSKNVNSNLRWEKGYNQNFGLDFAFLKDRISGSINYYHKKQVDLLGTYDVPVPPHLFNTIFANVGTLKNTGWEFDLRVDAIRSKDFTWTANANAYTNNNKFESFSNDIYTGQDYYNTCTMANPGNPGPLQRIEVGKRIGNYFTFRYAGVSDDGDWLIYDKDNKVIPIANGVEEDKTITGNGLPKFNAALTNNISWKNLDATISMRGAFGFEIFDVHDFYYGLQTRLGNLSSNAFRRNAKITHGSNVISDYFIHKGDYWMIDAVSLSYTFNIKHKFIDKVRLSGTANNLYTFTTFPGVDPSTYQVNGLTPGTFGGNISYYPSAFQFIFGIHVDF